MPMQMSENELGSRDQLRQLLFQIHLMRSYATGQGMLIPPVTAAAIAELGGLTERPEPETASGKAESAAHTLRWMESDAVATAVKLAFAVHGQLATLVKPATPESIAASEPRKTWRAKFSSPRVIDILIATTVIGIVSFGVGAWLANKSLPGLQLTYLGGALLGASFSGLYTAYKYVSDRTFDPGLTSTYVTRLLLGSVSGLILANFGQQLLASGADSANATKKYIAPGAMALVGGYSADAVNLILQRVTDMLVAAVRGGGDDVIKAKQAQLQAESKAAEAQHLQELHAKVIDVATNITDPAITAKLMSLVKPSQQTATSGAVHSNGKNGGNQGEAISQ